MDFYLKTISFIFPEKRIFHTAACLIQGFSQLGFRIRSNISLDLIDSRGISMPFSRTEKPQIESYNPEDPGFKIVDVTYGFGDMEVFTRLMSEKGVLLLNMSDGANFQDFLPSLHILTAHKNKFADRVGNFYAMPFAASEDIVKVAHEELRNLSGSRSDKIISNFKPSMAQGVRNFLHLAFESAFIKSSNLLNQAMDNDAYINALRKNKLICVYGGDLYRDLQKCDEFGDNSFKDNPAYQFKCLDREYLIFRWDSWRFYEAAIFGCIPINLNFTTYGMDLPVIPTDDAYVPIEFLDINKAVERVESLFSNESIWQETSDRISIWSRENYTPKPLAQYVLSILEGIYN